MLADLITVFVLVGLPPVIRTLLKLPPNRHGFQFHPIIMAAKCWISIKESNCRICYISILIFSISLPTCSTALSSIQHQFILEELTMTNRIKIGVAGLGRMGKRHVHNLIYRVPQALVVAVCSNLPHEVEWARDNEEYRNFGISVYDDYDEMLGHPGLEAIWVSTSTDVHAIQTLKGVKRGMHVLCEKPLSTDMAEAQRVVDAAEEKPELKVMAAFSRRFDDSYRNAARKIFETRAIGKPFMVRSQTGDLLDTTGFFVRYATRNGGIFVDCVWISKF